MVTVRETWQDTLYQHETSQFGESGYDYDPIVGQRGPCTLDDGRWEALLALWKPDEAGVLRSHPFIIGYRRGFYQDIWGGSAVVDPIYEVELGDVDGDKIQELIVLEASGEETLRAVTVWDWYGWGFSLRWRSQPGPYQDLVFSPAEDDHPPFVSVAVVQ